MPRVMHTVIVTHYLSKVCTCIMPMVLEGMGLQCRNYTSTSMSTELKLVYLFDTIFSLLKEVAM